MTGRLIAVVGPSGVGKDTIISHLEAVTSEYSVARRVITRAPELGGEDYDAVSVEEFERLKTSGAFCLSWAAHGLFYGIPQSARQHVLSGGQMLVNLSRKVLIEAHSSFPRFIVLNVSARADTLASRLRARGREAPDDIVARLSRQGATLPNDVRIHDLPNDGALEDTIAQALALLRKIEA